MANFFLDLPPEVPMLWHSKTAKPLCVEAWRVSRCATNTDINTTDCIHTATAATHPLQQRLDRRKVCTIHAGKSYFQADRIRRLLGVSGRRWPAAHTILRQISSETGRLSSTTQLYTAQHQTWTSSVRETQAELARTVTGQNVVSAIHVIRFRRVSEAKDSACQFNANHKRESLIRQVAVSSKSRLKTHLFSTAFC